MPLVRISYLRDDRPTGFGKQVGEVVYRTMRETLAVPEHNRFWLISEHDADTLQYDPGYLGVERSDGVVFIQIFLNQGRSAEMKKEFYRSLADGLHADLGMRREDVQVNLVEVPKENWSMGAGEAQYAD